jgi:hypothetical protein
MEKEFDRTEAETSLRDDLSENTSDENLQERLEPLEKQDNASSQSKTGQDQTIEAIPQTDAAQNPPEGTLTVEDEHGAETDEIAANESVDLHEEPLDMAPPEVAQEWADDPVEPTQTPREELEKDMLLSDEAETLSDMLAEPEMQADIEALMLDLEAEEVEPEEEPLEPS